jgi:hypothetical protein
MAKNGLAVAVSSCSSAVSIYKRSVVLARCHWRSGQDFLARVRFDCLAIFGGACLHNGRSETHDRMRFYPNCIGRFNGGPALCPGHVRKHLRKQTFKNGPQMVTSCTLL